MYALADQDRVRQVLINLVDNAIKYSPAGGEVKVQARGRGKLVEVRVSDQGIGISELDQRNLFRKFFRVDASQRGGIRGVGLGLFLVRGFVAAMGGRIWVESELGKGSTFVVELPASEEAPSATRELRACRIAASPLHILVVDDEPAIRLLCRVNLQADGMSVDEAWDSESAMVAAKARRPDAVLLDVMLPGDDGFAVAAMLRGEPGLEDVPIVLLTARADLDGSELVRPVGCRERDDEAVQPGRPLATPAGAGAPVSVYARRRIAALCVLALLVGGAYAAFSGGGSSHPKASTTTTRRALADGASRRLRARGARRHPGRRDAEAHDRGGAVHHGQRQLRPSRRRVARQHGRADVRRRPGAADRRTCSRSCSASTRTRPSS